MPKNPKHTPAEALNAQFDKVQRQLGLLKKEVDALAVMYPAGHYPQVVGSLDSAGDSLRGWRELAS